MIETKGDRKGIKAKQNESVSRLWIGFFSLFKAVKTSKISRFANLNPAQNSFFTDLRCDVH
jgi:hypothetical protein